MEHETTSEERPKTINELRAHIDTINQALNDANSQVEATITKYYPVEEWDDNPELEKVIQIATQESDAETTPTTLQGKSLELLTELQELQFKQKIEILQIQLEEEKQKALPVLENELRKKIAQKSADTDYKTLIIKALTKNNDRDTTSLLSIVTDQIMPESNYFIGVDSVHARYDRLCEGLESFKDLEDQNVDITDYEEQREKFRASLETSKQVQKGLREIGRVLTTYKGLTSEPNRFWEEHQELQYQLTEIEYSFDHDFYIHSAEQNIVFIRAFNSVIDIVNKAGMDAIKKECRGEPERKVISTLPFSIKGLEPPEGKE